MCYRASGHVDRFADLMVKDTVNGECFRLDHLIKSHLENLLTNKKVSEEQKQEYESVITKVRVKILLEIISNYNSFKLLA